MYGTHLVNGFTAHTYSFGEILNNIIAYMWRHFVDTVSISVFNASVFAGRILVTTPGDVTAMKRFHRCQRHRPTDTTYQEQYLPIGGQKKTGFYNRITFVIDR